MYTHTLLYRKQYTNFKGIIDTKTKNTSFLKMTKILKNMGINNRYFFLYLANPKLQGVDPYDPLLSQEMKLAILRECIVNPWYYIREVVRIPAQGSSGEMFQLHRANLALLWCFFNDVPIFITIPRQCGKTTAIIVLLSYVLFVRGLNLGICFMTKDNKLRTDTVKKMRDIRNILPSYVYIKSSSKEKDNTEEIEYKTLNNQFVSFVAQKDEIGAEKIGRGFPVPLAFIDEIVLFNNIHITYPTLMNSMISAYKIAEKNHQPRGVLISSTAGNLDTREGKFSFGLITEAYKFNDKLYDTNDREKLISILGKASISNRVYIEYGFLQLGKSKEDLIKAIANSKTQGSDKLQILRDLFNIWTRGSHQSPFNHDLLKSLKEHVQEPVFVEYIDEFTFNWYESKDKIHGTWMKSIPIVLGIDPSENIGRDYTTFVFVNGLDGSTIGTMRCNESNVIKVAILIFNFLIKYPNLLLNIERNSTGCVIVDKLIDDLLAVGINPLTKIFNKIVQEDGVIDGVDITRGSNRAKIGFRTTSSANHGRGFLLKNVLTKSLETFTKVIRDGTIINEVCGLTIRKNRIDHEEGSHDDMVFGRVLADYVLFFGKNIEMYDCYRKTNKKFLEYLSDDISFKTKDLKDEYNQQLIERIKELKELYRKTNIKIQKKKIELQIKYLLDKLDDKYHDIISKEESLRIDSKSKSTQDIQKERIKLGSKLLDYDIDQSSRFYDREQVEFRNVTNTNDVQLRSEVFFNMMEA